MDKNAIKKYATWARRELIERVSQRESLYGIEKENNNPTCKEKGLKRENGGVIDFEITVSISQLKRLSIYISNSYVMILKRRSNE